MWRLDFRASSINLFHLQDAAVASPPSVLFTVTVAFFFYREMSGEITHNNFRFDKGFTDIKRNMLNA